MVAPGVVFPLRYVVEGGSARVDLAWEVAENGAFEVAVYTEASLPQGHPVRLGRFAGQLGAEALGLLADCAGSLGAGGGPGRQESGSVARLLGIGGGDGVAVGGAAVPAGLEEALGSAAVAALAHPVAAVSVGADEGREHLTISGIGSAALPILLFLGDMTGFWLRVWRDDPSSPRGRVYLSYEEVEGLAQQGVIPEGPVDLAPGASVTVPLPGGGGSGSSGGFSFWRRGVGLERRVVAGTW